MKHAKIAQREKNVVEHRCMCGGVVKMVGLFENGKLRNVARCTKCGDKRRKPSDFVPA